MNYKTDGIIIKRLNLGEADRLLTIFTERFGKIKAIAKGVRKTKSRLAGSLEPFMLVDLQLYEGKTFYTVTGAEIREEFPKLHTDLNMISKAYYMSEILDKLIEDGQRHEELFYLYEAALKSLESDDSFISVEIFQLKLLGALGFQPQLYECVHCNDKLTANDNFWDSVEGGVICKKCKNIYGHGVKISDKAIKVLRLISEKDIFNTKIALDNELLDEIAKIITRYTTGILDKEIKSAKFMQEMIDVEAS